MSTTVLHHAFRRVAVVIAALLVVTTAPFLDGPAWAACTAPTAPRSPVATPGNASATVSWTAPTSNGGCAITKYTVTSLPVTTTKTNTGQLSLNFTGLANGTAYQFRVMATNSGNLNSVWSAYSAAVTPRTVPGAPTGVTATRIPKGAKVSWTAPTATGGSAITGYYVYPAVNGVAGSPYPATATARTIDLPHFTVGDSVTFTVKAGNVAGQGAASAATPALAVADVPAQPTGVTARPINQGAVVEWTAPAANGDPITGYTVTASPGASPPTISGTTATFTTLTNGTSYTFTVKATNGLGTGPASAPTAAIVPKDTTPNAPTNVTATAGDRSATVTWTPPDNTGKTAIVDYTVAALPGGVSKIVSGATASTATVTGLNAGGTYTFVVTARNSAGLGTPSQESGPVTLAAGPDAPTNVTATLVGTRVARVSWTQPADTTGITKYRVDAAPSGACRETTGLSSTVDVGSLPQGRDYVFRVQALTSGSTSCVRSANDGPWSAPSAPLTLPWVTAPAPLTDLDFVVLDGALRARWEARSDPPTSYVITANPGGITRTVSGTAVSAVIGGLENGIEYSVTITAINPAGATASAVFRRTPTEQLVSRLETVLPSYRAQWQRAEVSDDGRFVGWAEGGSGEESEPWLHSALLADRSEQVVYQLANRSTSIDWDVALQLSGNGRYVAFSETESRTADDHNGVSDVYVLDRVTDALTRVSENAAGDEPNGASVVADVSPDGRYVLFTSSASNLVPNDANGRTDLFLKDTVTGALELVSVFSGATQMSGVGSTGFVSADGRYVVGYSTALGSFWRDRADDVTVVVGAPFGNDRTTPVGLTRDGATLTYEAMTDPFREGRLGAVQGSPAYRSVYQQQPATSSAPVIVSIGSDFYDLANASGSGVSPDGTLVLVDHQGNAVLRDTARGRTSHLYAGNATGSALRHNAGIAANNRTIAVGYKPTTAFDTQMRALEFLRDEPAQDRVWWAAWRQRVNTMTGEYSESITDADVRGVGLPLRVTRTYHSGTFDAGWFGVGWTSSYEMRIESRGTARLVVHGDGRRELFTYNGGSPTDPTVLLYKPPKGSGTRLAGRTDGTYTVTLRDASTARFSGGGRLLALSSPQGHDTVLTYSGGRVATITDTVSGRALYVTWSGERVSKVETDHVGAHARRLAWTYGYNGDSLTSVCEPHAFDGETRCRTNTYDGGRLAESFNAYAQRILHVTYHPDGRVQSSATDGVHASTFAYVAPSVTEVTDARGFTTRHEYDGAGRLTKEVDPYGKARTTTYDANGWPAQRTDENGTVTTTAFSSTGDLTSERVGQNGAVAGATAYFTYDADHNVLTTRDRRSASSSDATYLTTRTYTNNNLTSETGPPVTGFPAGVVRTWAYSAGTEPAIGGGTVPPRLLLTATDGRGKVTRFRYASNGDLMEVENAAGLVTRYTYDELGRQTLATEVSDAFPAGLTTTYTYDELSRVVIETAPLTQDEVSGDAHQPRVSRTYDRAGRLTRLDRSDAAGLDPSRVSDFGVDQANRVTSMTDNETGAAEAYEYDAAGNLKAVVDRLARRTEIAYTKRNQRESVTRKAVRDGDGLNPRDVVVASYTYDDAGRLLTETDVLGRTRRVGYDTFNRPTSETLLGFVDPTGAVRDVVVTRARFDAEGNLVESWRGSDILHETFTSDAMNRVVQHVLFNTNGVDRTTTSTYDGGGLELTRSLAGGTRTETVTRTYDDLGNPESETVENGATDLTTWFRHDDRGLLVSTTDPRATAAGEAAYTTEFGYDELRRQVAVTRPAGAHFTVGVGATTGRPATATGYNAFGEAVRFRDEAGAVTTATYDRVGRRTRVDHAPYTRPSDGLLLTPYETWTWDPASRVESYRDRRGGVTTYHYNGLDHVVKQVDPAVLAGAPTWRFATDDAGRVTSVTDPVGAVQTTAYDKLDRVTTETDVVRSLTGGATVNAATRYRYDDLGRLTRREEPHSASAVWTYTYEAAGNPKTVTDPLSKVTSATYDVAGRLTGLTDPLNRRTEHVFDLAGRRTAENHYDAANVRVSHETFGYDAAGNLTTRTSPRGKTTVREFDALDRLTVLREPVDATHQLVTTFGYDTAGRVTRTTDARGNDWVAGQPVTKLTAAYDVLHTYNPWGLPESTIEPVTAAHPADADRTWTTSYDGAGNPVHELRPGGVAVTRAFDALDRLTTEHGEAVAGAPAVPLANRTLGYDLAGNLTSAAHPAGTLTYTYDDRGDLATAAGAAGTTTITRDVAGRPSSIVDYSGTHTFTWTLRNEVDTEREPLTGVTIDRDYDNAGQVTVEKLGASAGVRRFTYDAMGRVLTDQVENSTAVVQAKTTYGYDADGNVTSQAVTATGNTAAGTHTYAYDDAGRITSWTKPGGVTSEAYTWDRAGNRLTAGTRTYTYDERSRLLTGGGAAYAWSPRGTLATRTPTGGTAVPYSFDGFDRMVGAGAATYSYDSLDRLANTGFQYTGLNADPTKTPTSGVSRSVSGAPVGFSTGGVATLLGTNRHGDAAVRYNSAGGIAATKVYEPFGTVAGVTGSTGDVGFQTDYRDNGTGLIWMGARWYDSASGTFLSRDTMARHNGSLKPMNRYGYGDANPVTLADPDGHCTSTGYGGCSANAGPGSYTVDFAAGAYADASFGYDSAPAPMPATSYSSTNPSGNPYAGWTEDPDLAVFYEYHRRAGILLGGASAALSVPLDAALRFGRRVRAVVGHLNDPVQVAKDVVNTTSAVYNGLARWAEDTIEFGSWVLHTVSRGAVPEVEVTGALGRVPYAFDDARSREYSSLAEDVVATVGPPTAAVATVGGKLARAGKTAAGAVRRAVTNAGDALRGLRTGARGAGVARGAHRAETPLRFYVRMADTLDVSTARNEAVLYSGWWKGRRNRDRAEEFARANGKKTLEMTPGGAWLDAQQLYGPNSPLTVGEADFVWRRMSKRYVEGASGTVVGFVKGAGPTSVFNEVELWALYRNKNVTNLITGGD